MKLEARVAIFKVNIDQPIHDVAPYGTVTGIASIEITLRVASLVRRNKRDRARWMMKLRNALVSGDDLLMTLQTIPKGEK